MPFVQKSAQVPYSAEKMYDLVNALAEYPQFLPWCAKAEVLESSKDSVLGRLTIVKGPFRETFTTRNTLVPYQKIQLSLVSGPFKQLQGNWSFTNADSDPKKGSVVELALSFEFGSGLAAQLIRPIFEGIANRLVEAFCARAHALYGGDSPP